MLLEELTLCDFGLFMGEHRFRLAPNARHGNARPIVLFGGLNGAGKTTILSAIRLALYGRQSLGHAISQRVYEEYLADRIHRNKTSLVSPISAHVALEFKYYKLREAIQYKVVRSWTVTGKSVTENLLLYQDNSFVSDFNREQCQAFLNELVPIGVSDLFFFDGEKISALAEDNGDLALRDAIRKLLGLDIIERLNNDLGIYGRRHNRIGLPKEADDEIKRLEAQLGEFRELAQREQMAAASIRAEMDTATNEAYRLEQQLAARGGAWSGSRKSLLEKQEQLLHHREQVESEIHEFMSGLYPIGLVKQQAEALVLQLRQEERLKSWSVLSEPLKAHIKNLKIELRKRFKGIDQKSLSEVIDNNFSPLLAKPRDLDNVSLRHNLSEKDAGLVTQWVNTTFNHVVPKAAELKATFDELDEQLARVGVQLERAPDEDSLKSEFEYLKAKHNLIGALNAQFNASIERARRSIWQAIETVRKLKRAETDQRDQGEKAHTIRLAEATRTVLSDFSAEVTRRKVAKLESEFVQTFTRLARKEDAITKAVINPDTFTVTIFDNHMRPLAKKDLSAGEKQIYAVAMLDALARTSGRKLPVIIDTPLGRLDSLHRANLVENYFPYASHQVIILSTDTEIDQKFYAALTGSISHAYHLVYDDAEEASFEKEGFFWKATTDREAYAT